MSAVGWLATQNSHVVIHQPLRRQPLRAGGRRFARLAVGCTAQGVGVRGSAPGGSFRRLPTTLPWLVTGRAVGHGYLRLLQALLAEHVPQPVHLGFEGFTDTGVL